jgi:hypothetical protein
MYTGEKRFSCLALFQSDFSFMKYEEMEGTEGGKKYLKTGMKYVWHRKIHFIPHRQHRMLPLEREDCKICIQKPWLFIVRIIYKTQ